MMEIKKAYEPLAWAACALIAAYIIANTSGIKLLIILSLAYILPGYLLISEIFPNIEDKVIISFFLAIGIVPSLTYIISFATGIKIAAVCSSGIILGCWAVMRFLLKHKKKHSQE